jgi:hypothetical protein
LTAGSKTRSGIEAGAGSASRINQALQKGEWMEVGIGQIVIIFKAGKMRPLRAISVRWRWDDRWES